MDDLRLIEDDLRVIKNYIVPFCWKNNKVPN